MGFTGLCANSWWLQNTTCARHCTSIVLHFWDSPRHKVISQCWYEKDQDVLGSWCSPVHQKVERY
ncbi:unnamed protein product [Staurois parvus]|uniref:Uncharacterized protein n=1 Tax=Staurois parvus TaxID=386267 RepID=A0ABN9EF72_9NEOB|nr:unnamed protein product [Staurois parvus]